MLPVMAAGGPGRGPGPAAAPPARGARALRRGPRRPRPRRPARAHPLAVAELVRLLPGQRSGPSILGELVSRRARRPGDAVGDRPGVHRARDPRARLVGRAPGPARPVPSTGTGGGVIQDTASTRPPVRDARGPGTSRRRRGPAPACGPTRRPRPTRRSRRASGSAGMDDRPAAADRRRRRVRHAAGRSGRGHPGRPRRRAGPVLRGRHRRHHVVDGGRPDGRDRRRVHAATGCGSTSTRRWPARPRSFPSCGGWTAGADRADSWCFDPHKWLFTNFDCDVMWVADRGPLIRALSVLPEYLRNAGTESGAVIDYRDWHVPARPPLPGPQAVVRAPPVRRRGPAPPPRAST